MTTIQPGMKLTAARLNPAPPGIAYSPSTSAAIGTTETVVLTIPNMVFKAGKAYKVTMKAMMYGSVAGALGNFRVRKTNASGADWGEYGRTRCEGTNSGSSVGVGGSPLYLTRSANTDLTADVVLTCSANTGNTVTLWASAATPRTFLIEEVGDAADYLGLGVDVT